MPITLTQTKCYSEFIAMSRTTLNASYQVQLNSAKIRFNIEFNGALGIESLMKLTSEKKVRLINFACHR